MPSINSRDHDVIVVGTGMGGSVLGYALARAGKRVLFCEQGLLTSNPAVNKGCYAESTFRTGMVSASEHSELLHRAARYNKEIEDVSYSKLKRFVPFIGAGTGGSTGLFGMALERLFPCDFFPKRNFRDVPNTTTLPESWPITYEDLSPYYQVAEKLFRVRGSVDPLRQEENFDYLPAPSLSKQGEELYRFLDAKGFHPYRLPLACDHVSGCECCQGYLCAQNCKNDCYKICLAPALEQFGARLIENCEVIKLEASEKSVTGVVCQSGDKKLTLEAPTVVLAAGALKTPAILLNSASSIWPNGLANTSGLVGKNLMRHLIDLYVLTPKSTTSVSAMKELAINDFYVVDGKKFGSVQSFGAMPPGEVVTAPFELRLRTSFAPVTGSLFGRIRPIVDRRLTRFFSSKIILASILEDLPYSNNQVTLVKAANVDRPCLNLRYQVSDYDRDRTQQFRKYIRSALKPYRVRLLKQAENNERIAHACGTCRFGVEPETSVLDSMNRAHGLSNLYIVDSSFFPSSGGINPALTIAANALRVADFLIHER